MSNELSERCRNRWPSILMQLGIDLGEKVLRHQNGPCPMCSGKDRFNFGDKGYGAWWCRGCGLNGDGFKLVMAVKGNITFVEAAKLVESVVGSAQTSYKKNDWRKQTDGEREAIAWMWRNATPLKGDCLGSKYLEGRGIDRMPDPGSVRFCESVTERDLETRKVTMRPALLTRFIAHDDSLARLHFTYLSPFGGKADCNDVKRFQPGTVPMGGAARLAPASEEMGVSTGIETSLSAMQLHGVPCWATLTDVALMKFVPPPVCKKLIIFGDRDVRYSGQMHAHGLAYRLSHLSTPLDVETRFPVDDKDWNDVAQKRTQGVIPLVRFSAVG
jgi:putative DNA primase/helicase